MYALSMMVFALVLASPADTQVRCTVLVTDALSRPVVDARVTCGGVRAKGTAGTYSALVPTNPDGHVIAVTRAGYLPQERTVQLASDATTIISLRRRGEPYLVDEGHVRPFVVERKKLLVTIAPSPLLPEQRAAVMVELAPLLTSLKLVEVPSRSTVFDRGNRCFAGELLALARTDGRPFKDDIVPELEALRAHPSVFGAGPLVRFGVDQDSSLGHVIGVSGPVDLAPFAAKHGATWDAAKRKLVLPRAIGLAAADITRALVAEYPDARARLERVEWVCQF